MKELWKSGVLFLIIIAVLYIIFLRECKRPELCPATDEVIIKKATWDSILALANKPPVVIIDTQWIEGPTVYLPGEPLPPVVIDPADTTVSHYSDSLVKKDINVRVEYTINGRLLAREWFYKPIIVEIKKDSIVYVPKIVPVEKEIPVPHNGLYAYGLAGGNKDMFLFGGGIDFITKKETEFGYLYQRFGNENIHSVKIGAKLFNKK